jgi:hypothetical protein
MVPCSRTACSLWQPRHVAGLATVATRATPSRPWGFRGGEMHHQVRSGEERGFDAPHHRPGSRAPWPGAFSDARGAEQHRVPGAEDDGECRHVLQMPSLFRRLPVPARYNSMTHKRIASIGADIAVSANCCSGRALVCSVVDTSAQKRACSQKALVRGLGRFAHDQLTCSVVHVSKHFTQGEGLS